MLTIADFLAFAKSVESLETENARLREENTRLEKAADAYLEHLNSSQAEVSRLRASLRKERAA